MWLCDDWHSSGSPASNLLSRNPALLEEFWQLFHGWHQALSTPLHFLQYLGTVLKLWHILPYFIVSSSNSLNPGLWLVSISFLLSHHCTTKFFVLELAQKSMMTIWIDLKIICANHEAEICCYLGFLENKLRRAGRWCKEWEMEWSIANFYFLVSLNIIGIRLWRGQCEEYPLCQLGKSSHDGCEPIMTGCFTWIISNCCWFSPPCSLCDDPYFKTEMLNGLNFIWKTILIGSPFRILFCCQVHERSGKTGMKLFSPSPSVRQPQKRTVGVPWPAVWKRLWYL